MPKSNKHHKNPKPRFTRSDIPYADRMLMNQYRSTAAQRDDATGKALKLVMVALNNTPGVNLGYARLVRFADEYRKVCDEYYAERLEVGDAHIDERLEKMGFLVRDGHIYVIEDDNGGLVDKAFLAEKLAKTGDYTQEDLDKLGVTEAQVKKIMEVSHAE